MIQSCGRPFAEEWISGYLDEAIDRDEGRHVRRHLRHCARCRRLLADFRELRNLVSGLPERLIADGDAMRL